MELVELVSPHVAMPVIGVVVCAIMVFAFGFRSPVQPPSFDFEEDENKRIKRRPKGNKVKGSSNGNVQNEVSLVVTSSKPTIQLNKEKKGNSQSPKAKVVEPKILSKKENKQESKPTGKVKKQTGKEGQVKVSASVPEKKEFEDDGEWTTIQQSKKGKKQKATNKKDEGQAESAVTPSNENESAPAPHAAAAAAAAPQTPEIEEPKTPQSEKGKKKKKGKAEEKEASDSQPVVESPVLESSHLEQQPEEQQMEVKKKKNKREKKSSGPTIDADGAAASASESLPQDATPASGKAPKKEASAIAPLDVAEDTVDIPRQTPKKKKGKAKAVIESTERIAEVKSIPAERQESSEQITKPEKSKSSEKVENDSVPLVKEEVPEASVSDKTSSNAAQSGVNFDEMGDLWIEAAPKSKKKKPRREN